MSPPESVEPISRTIQMVAGQCFNIHLIAGSVVHVEHGRITVTAAPRWLAGGVSQAAHALCAGGVLVIDAAGWTCLSAQGQAQCTIIKPAQRPAWWRLIKLRLGRSGSLLGNSRPPDTKAAEPSVPHATSQ